MYLVSLLLVRLFLQQRRPLRLFPLALAGTVFCALPT
jgi:hypothetical protein